jgi:hypothetical protein
VIREIVVRRTPVLASSLPIRPREPERAVRSHDYEDAQTLPPRGADVVLSPFVDAATRAVELLGITAVEYPAGFRAASANAKLAPPAATTPGEVP